VALIGASDRRIDDRETLRVVQRELLGVVRQDADRIHGGRDEVVDDPALPPEVEGLVFVEDRGRNGYHTAKQGSHHRTIHFTRR
jgi:hypothetical protein